MINCNCQDYRNGSTFSDNELCMGPSENWGRPCYPYNGNCNADWTYCNNEVESPTDRNCINPIWTKKSNIIGKKPDCPNAIIRINQNDGYIWNTLNKCKEICFNKENCNVIVRFGGHNETDNWHCRAHICEDLSNINWIDESRWGNGSSTAVPYILNCNEEQESPTDPPTDPPTDLPTYPPTDLPTYPPIEPLILDPTIEPTIEPINNSEIKNEFLLFLKENDIFIIILFSIICFISIFKFFIIRRCYNIILQYFFSNINDNNSENTEESLNLIMQEENNEIKTNTEMINLNNNI